MNGMLHSIRNFVSKMSPTDVREGFQCYKTNKYVLNYLETPSGVKYVMNTDLNSQGVRELLQAINSQVYFFIYCMLILELNLTNLFSETDLHRVLCEEPCLSTG